MPPILRNSSFLFVLQSQPFYQAELVCMLPWDLQLHAYYFFTEDPMPSLALPDPLPTATRPFTYRYPGKGLVD